MIINLEGLIILIQESTDVNVARLTSHGSNGFEGFQIYGQKANLGRIDLYLISGWFKWVLRTTRNGDGANKNVKATSAELEKLVEACENRCSGLLSYNWVIDKMLEQHLEAKAKAIK